MHQVQSLQFDHIFENTLGSQDIQEGSQKYSTDYEYVDTVDNADNVGECQLTLLKQSERTILLDGF